MRISDCSSDVCSSDLLRFDRAPRIFQVNWFRKGTDGRFLWPGFGENSRVIDWIIRRVDGQAGAVENQNGRIPSVEELKIGRASGRERGCQYVVVWGGAG